MVEQTLVSERDGLKKSFVSSVMGFPPLGERFAQLEEALELINALWKAQPIENKGRFYDLRGAVCSPQPLV